MMHLLHTGSRFRVPDSRHLGILALSVLLTLFACRETERQTAIAPLGETQATQAQLAVESGTGEALIVALRLSPGTGATGKLGSITASVQFDTTLLVFAGDEASGGMRAARADRDVVRLAVASMTGLDSTVARLRFLHRTGQRGTGALQLRIAELHSMDGSDARAGLVILPAAGVK